LIHVLDEQTDRRAGRPPFEHAGENAHAVRFLALAGVPRGSGAPPLELDLNVLFRQLKPRRATVDDRAERGPMALAEGRDSKEYAECVTGHGP